jgi:RND family efflux transporter MFP subunit
MSKAKLIRRLAATCIAASLGFSAASAVAQEGSRSYGTDYSYRGFTAPSEQRGLNFNVPGVVSKVLVKEGDAVKNGQLIAQQDDSVEQADLAVRQAEVLAAELKIKAQTEDLHAKEVELKRDQEMFAKKVLGESDLDKAKVEVEIGKIAVKLAEQERDGKTLEVKAQQAKIAQKKLYSTIDGIVQRINVHEGELATNDPKTPCLQVVLNEPLYVEVDLPVALTQSLQLKQALKVRYVTEDKWQDAKIIYFNPVGTGGAATQHVRLELANAEHGRSGRPVDVKLGEKVAAVDTSR